MTSTEDPRDVAIEASKPGAFSFLDRVTNRNYPTEEVVVYIDEEGAYKRSKLLREIDEQMLLLRGDDKAAAAQRSKKITILRNKTAELEERILKSRVVFHLEGISSDAYDELIDKAAEQFPVEYVESRNPLTMELERTPKSDDNREAYFRSLLWSKFVRKISDGEGNEDTTCTPAYMAAVMGAMPIVGVAHVQAAIERLRMTTNWMDEIQGDDFFPKS